MAEGVAASHPTAAPDRVRAREIDRREQNATAHTADEARLATLRTDRDKVACRREIHESLYAA